MGYKTPNIDRIAHEGLMFTDYYAEQSCTAGLGWIVGSNLHIDFRFSSADPGLAQNYAEELVGLAPEVILAHMLALTWCDQLDSSRSRPFTTNAASA
jgi:arylsulfatase A-like enzyme